MFLAFVAYVNGRPADLWPLAVQWAGSIACPSRSAVCRFLVSLPAYVLLKCYFVLLRWSSLWLARAGFLALFLSTWLYRKSCRTVGRGGAGRSEAPSGRM